MNRLSLLPLILIVVSCGVLEPVKDGSDNHVLDPVVPERSISGGSPAVAVARPSLPGYLDRQQLVTRTADGRILMNRNHLWAEPLDTGISRVVAANLARIENSLNIQPVESFVTLEYDQLLEIRITRFEPDESGAIVLDCAWKLQPVRGPAASPRTFRTTTQAGPDFSPSGPQQARIVAMNEALARLSREISLALQ